MAAGSFWSNFGLRFTGGGSSSNGLDELLERGPGRFTLEEVLLHEQCIQEAKYMNQALCDYLAQPEVVMQLVRYVITVPKEARNLTKPDEVGGGIDSQGGITTAADIRLKAERAQKAAAAAAAAAAGTAAESTEGAAAASADAAAKSDEAKADSTAATDEGFLPSDDDDEEAEAAAAAAARADLAAENAQKYPYLASELFACEVPTMLDAIFEDGEQMQSRRGSVQINSANSTGTLDSLPEDAPVDGKDSEADGGAASSDAASAAASSASAAAAAAPSPAASPDDSTLSDGSASGVKRLPILDLLLSFLDNPAPLDPAHASYFRKVMVVLIQRKYDPLVRYMSAHGTLEKLLRHIGLYSIMECLIMIGWDDGLGGNQDVQWLVDADLTGQLIAKLSPRWETEEKQPDVLINASRALVDVVVKCPAASVNPLITRLLSSECMQQLFTHMFSGSQLSLSNALSIVIVLVQRYANRMDLGIPVVVDEEKAAALQVTVHQAIKDADDPAAAVAAANAAVEAAAGSGDGVLVEPFRSLVPHLARILRLLDTEVPAETAWSYGRGIAFGETRLKVVELILVLVRCKVAAVEAIFVQEKLMHKLLDAFFLYPWNNMLHGLVESIIRTTLEYLPQGTPLKQALFQDAKLVDRVLDAYEANRKVCEKGAGYRLGYMGHLLRTADVIEQYLSSEGLDHAVRNTSRRDSEDSSRVNPTDADFASGSAAARLRVLGSEDAVSRWAAFLAGPLAAEAEAQRVVLPAMAGDDDAFDMDDPSGGGDHDASELAAAAEAQRAAAESGGGGVNEDFFNDPDDSSGFDFSGAMDRIDMPMPKDWADFNAHFGVAPPDGDHGALSDDEDDGRPPQGSGAGRPQEGGLGSEAAQRRLMEFALQPDEDAGPDSEEEGEQGQQPTAAAASADDQDDWANFDAPKPAEAASAAAAAPAASAEAGASGASADGAAAPAAAAPAAADDDFADFPVEFPK